MKFEYVVTAIVVMGGYITLTTIVTIKMMSATQLDLATKIAVMTFLWGFILFGIRTFVRYYKELN
jgi:hypothetical protein